MLNSTRHRLLVAAISIAAMLGAGAASAGAATTARPAGGSLLLFLRGTYAVGHQQVTIPSRSVKVQGIVKPYVPGQWVKMKVYFNHRLIHTYGVRVKSAGGSSGKISYRVSAPGSGHMSVLVVHDANAKQASFSSRHGFAVLSDSAGFGSSGPFVQLIQQRLSALHFYIPQSGVYDQGTGLALDAYHRLLRWGTYQTLDQRTVNALMDGTGSFSVRYPGDGKHAEGNLSLQLLALTNGSNVVWIFPISSGKPSTPTVLGRFHIYRRTPGYLPDGMYYSSFFYTGYAIHGYNPAPDYPASHGCMRLPIVDAIPAYNWLGMGDGVDVYY